MAKIGGQFPIEICSEGWIDVKITKYLPMLLVQDHQGEGLTAPATLSDRGAPYVVRKLRSEGQGEYLKTIRPILIGLESKSSSLIV